MFRCLLSLQRLPDYDVVALTLRVCGQMRVCGWATVV